MERITLAVASLTVLPALAASAQAANPTACSLLKSAEYAKVLAHPVKMSPGEGTSNCHVFVGASPMPSSLWVIPNLNPYNAKYVTHMEQMIDPRKMTRSTSGLPPAAAPPEPPPVLLRPSASWDGRRA
jgi:hypothetical protein